MLSPKSTSLLIHTNANRRPYESLLPGMDHSPHTDRDSSSFAWHLPADRSTGLDATVPRLRVLIPMTRCALTIHEDVDGVPIHHAGDRVRASR